MPACSEFCNEQRVGVYCARENIIESSVCGRQARANSGDEKVRANSARKVNERLLLIEAALPGIRASRWNSWMERMGNSESLMEEESRQSDAQDAVTAAQSIPEVCPTMCMSILYADMLYACNCIQNGMRKIIAEKKEVKKMKSKI